jgi:hypothetical protein
MFWQDPVCGSAHCVLAPYWGGKLGKHKLTAFQVRFCNTLVFPWSIIRLVFEFILVSPGISTEWNTIPGVRSCRQESANSGRSCYCDDWYPPSVAAQWTSAVFSLVVRHDYSAARNKLRPFHFPSQPKIFLLPPITSNLSMHAWSIKCR